MKMKLLFSIISLLAINKSYSLNNIQEVPNGTVKKFSGNDMTPYENNSQFQKKYSSEQERRAQVERELQELKNKLGSEKQDANIVNNDKKETTNNTPSTQITVSQNEVSPKNEMINSLKMNFPIKNKQKKSQIKSTSTSSPASLVVKVKIDCGSENLKSDEQIVASTTMYKRIYIKDSDRTRDVKRTILEKFLLDRDTCDKYSLVQVFNQNSSQKDLLIGDNCNVFYAARNETDMEFVLRRKLNTGLSMSNGALNGNQPNNLPNIVFNQQKSTGSTGSNNSSKYANS